ncbi:PREDICTED: auxin-responsive protein SAUR23 [Nelumbo nucifera]|uniref:Auxin-responsive protein SAUR23 n=2 Tax=Nelumbo nucifera TaxID=4432 RepID=A0A1U7ZPV4_NELNU|nr:PREDICTED: auxin-responsive protein SAUR23 [Nelumbo nucifera]DAD26752.1 TPA_asm: hypothetical protein HUJ06_028220 [Nelumbo nucifera]
MNQKMMKGTKLFQLQAWLRKWRRMSAKVFPSATCDYPYRWRWALREEEEVSIPKDVPRGHLVVYVGENCKRFVIKVTLLKHPLFRALLDRARDEYDFMAADSKLCIPCDETMFLDVVRCAKSPPDPRICLFCR